ncbi:hypothetical protein Tco_0633462 [Tanacetum coccineum]
MGCDENRMSINLAAAVFVAVSILKALKTEDLSRKLEVNYVKFQFRGGLLVPTGSNAKFPYLKKDKYETWAMKMEYWIMNSDHNLWNIVLHGNSRKWTGRDPRGNIMILPPVTMEEQIVVQRETKARNIYFQSLPEDHMADFHHLDDAKDIWLAVKARFGGNEESKKMRKSMLKQEFADFLRPVNEDCNMKFLRALPPSWSQVAITLKTKGGLDFLSFDDLYNKLRTLEIDLSFSAASTNIQVVKTAGFHVQPSSVSYTTTLSLLMLQKSVLQLVVLKVIHNKQITLKTLTKLASWLALPLPTPVSEHQMQMAMLLCLLKKKGQVLSMFRVGHFCKRMYREDGGSKNKLLMVFLINGVFVAAGNGSDDVSVAAGVGADGVSVTSSDATDAETQFALMGLSPQDMEDTFGSDEVFDLSAPSIFDSCLKDAIEKPLYDWFVKPVGMHVVPPPITGTFMASFNN